MINTEGLTQEGECWRPMKGLDNFRTGVKVLGRRVSESTRKSSVLIKEVTQKYCEEYRQCDNLVK